MSRKVAHWYQDSNESVARTMNWSADLNGSTIAGVTWVMFPPGLTTDATSNTTTTTSIRLSGGIPGMDYRVTCSVVTAASETLEAHALLTIDN
jgi:hypothetical protein